jgi:hypothetical protein
MKSKAGYQNVDSWISSFTIHAPDGSECPAVRRHHATHSANLMAEGKAIPASYQTAIMPQPLMVLGYKWVA